jgi:hypothetical protein
MEAKEHSFVASNGKAKIITPSNGTRKLTAIPAKIFEEDITFGGNNT